MNQDQQEMNLQYPVLEISGVNHYNMYSYSYFYNYMFTVIAKKNTLDGDGERVSPITIAFLVKNDKAYTLHFQYWVLEF